MPRFAHDTVVPVERSRAEIEAMVVKYGATHFTSGWTPDAAQIAFQLKELWIRFLLPIPKKDDPKFKFKIVKQPYGGGRTIRKALTENQAEKSRDQEIRSRWRALSLVVKAKLEAVECGISTLENEFLAFIVLPGQAFTVGEWMHDNAMQAIRGGTMPLILEPHRLNVVKENV